MSVRKPQIFLTFMILVVLALAYLYPAVAMNIPKKPDIPQKYILHVVLPRDTLWELSKAHMPKVDPRLGVKAIRDVNGLDKGYMIQPGDVLSIPSVKGELQEPLGPEYSTEEADQEAEEAFAEILPVAQEQQRLRDTQMQSSWGINYREIVMEATAYTSGPESTGKGPGHPAYRVTYSGLPAAPGAVAVDPRR